MHKIWSFSIHHPFHHSQYRHIYGHGTDLEDTPLRLFSYHDTVLASPFDLLASSLGVCICVLASCFEMGGRSLPLIIIYMDSFPFSHISFNVAFL